MKTILKKTIKGLSILLLAVCVYFTITSSIWYFWYGYRGQDVFDGIFFGLFLPFNSTRYSENFSDEKMSLIKMGMSPDEVKLILGKPLVEYRFNDDSLGFEYSCYSGFGECNPVDGYFHQRRISFDQNDRVSSITREFWID